MPTTFANQINGDDIYAKRAECDAAGNTLSTTYATKAELPEGVPPVTSSDNNKVLKASYSEGTGSYSWQTESGGGGAQADWTESDDSDPSYIQNKPTILGLTAGSNVTITEGNDSVTIAATDTTYTAGTGLTLANGEFSVDTTTVAMKTDIPSVPVTDVTVDGTSVVSNGTAAIVMPTVPTTDQTYNSSSTNPQSGTAVAGAIAGVSQVPAVTSSDDTKVLTASYTGGVASYSWETAQGGGGTSNVTTADKQINVAVNGTGLPMQLNLLNPVGTYGTISLGSPTISVKEIEYPMTGDTFYAPVIEWTFSRSDIAPSNPSAATYRVPLTLSIPNDIIIVSGSDREFTSNYGPQPSVYLDVNLLNASDDSTIAYLSSSQYIFSNGGYTDPPGDIKLLEGTYGPDEFSFDANRSIYDAASTLRLSMVIDWTYYDQQTGTGSRLTQQEAQAMASAIAQQGTMTLTAPSGSPTAYTSYIGSTAISAQTFTADSGFSGLYRYDFTAEQTAALVPGMYLVQAPGPSSSGTQTTYVYLYKDGNTGYDYYTLVSKASYLSSSGGRREIFLMNLEANTTAIGTRVSGGNFTMVRIG